MSKKRANLLHEFEQNAVALFVFDPAGEILREPRIHPAGEHAPYSLIGFALQNVKDEIAVVSELGVSRVHPYNELHVPNLKPRLPNRKPLGGLGVKHLQSACASLVKLLNSLVAARIHNWRSPVETEWWHDHYLRGIAVSVSRKSEDATLLRFFEEWELMNLSLDYRLERLAWRLNREQGEECMFHSTKRKRQPGSFYYFRELLKRKHGNQTRVLLRPHVLGELSRWLRYPAEFVDFLFQENVIDGTCATIATQTMSMGARQAYGFKILPSEAKGWRRRAVHDNKEMLAVYPLSMDDSYITFRITVKGHEWTEQRGKKLALARKLKDEARRVKEAEPWREW